MFKNKIIGILILLLVFALIFSGCSSQETPKSSEQENKAENKSESKPESKPEPVVLKLGHALPDGHPVDLSSEKFAEIVRERTNGLVEIQVFPAAQLGNEKDMLEGLNMGVVDMGAIVAGPYGYLQPEFEVMSLVYLFKNPSEAEKVLKGKIGQELSEKLLKNKGVRIIHPFWYYGTRQLTSNKIVEKPSDLDGLKVRVPEVPIQKEGLSAMGAQATPVDFGELYMALKTGVVDAEENPLATIHSNNFDQVQKYLVMTNHIVTEFMLSINEKKFQKLTPEQQQILFDAAEEAANYNNDLVLGQEDKILNELKDRGMEVINPELDPFIDKVNELHKKYDEKYDGIITKIKDATK